MEQKKTIYLVRYGVRGQKKGHRYHQSYATKPTRSGMVGEEHGDAAKKTLKNRLEEVSTYNKNSQKIIEDYSKQTREELKKSYKDLKDFKKILKQEYRNDVKEKGLLKALQKQIEYSKLDSKIEKEYIQNYHKGSDKIFKSKEMKDLIKKRYGNLKNIKTSTAINLNNINNINQQMMQQQIQQSIQNNINQQIQQQVQQDIQNNINQQVQQQIVNSINQTAINASFRNMYM